MLRFFSFETAHSQEFRARARARIQSFDDDYEHRIIEHEQDSVTISLKNRNIKSRRLGLPLRAIGHCHSFLLTVLDKVTQHRAAKHIGLLR
jgi:hypothetical protein